MRRPAVSRRYRRAGCEDGPSDGWTTVSDRELLALATGTFDVFVTVDRNLSFQQNLAPLPISVFVLHAKTNRLSDPKPLVPRLLAAIETAPRGVAHIIDAV